MQYPLSTPELIQGYQLGNRTEFSEMTIREAITKRINNIPSLDRLFLSRTLDQSANQFLYFSWDILFKHFSGGSIFNTGTVQHQLSEYFFTKIPVASVAYLFGMDHFDKSTMTFKDFVYLHFTRYPVATDFLLTDVLLVLPTDPFLLYNQPASSILTQLQASGDKDLFQTVWKMIPERNAESSLFDAYYKSKNSVFLPKQNLFTQLQTIVGEMTGSQITPSLNSVSTVTLNDLKKGKMFAMRNFTEMRFIDLVAYLSKGLLIISII